MPSKDKRKKIQKRLSKLKKLERKEKKKKRTKTKGSKSSNLYQEYVYQKKNRTNTYLLVLFIVLLLCAVGAIVYFTIIKPKLDKNKKPECNKNENEDCQINEYLDKEKCECLPCENPNPTCKTDEYYDPNNIPYCRNSTKYTTDKDGNKKKMYSCQPCPTCPDGKKVNQCGGGKYDINNKDTNEACLRPSSDNNIDSKKGLSGGAIAGIVIGIVLFLGLGVFIYYKTKDANEAKELRIQPFSNNNIAKAKVQLERQRAVNAQRDKRKKIHNNANKKATGLQAGMEAQRATAGSSSTNNINFPPWSSEEAAAELQAAMEAQRAEEERLANVAKKKVAKANKKKKALTQQEKAALKKRIVAEQKKLIAHYKLSEEPK